MAETIDNADPPGIDFFDATTSREMRLVTAGAYAGWLVYRHRDGQWVSLRRATHDDHKKIESADG